MKLMGYVAGFITATNVGFAGSGRGPGREARTGIVTAATPVYRTLQIRRNIRR